MGEATILRDDDGRVAVLTINRPEALNAFDAATIGLLGELVAAAVADERIRVLFVTGAGDRAFSTGGDMKEWRALGGKAVGAILEAWHETLGTVHASPKPVIAAIKGYAYGGGTELAMACHIRMAGESAKLGQTEMAHDHIPGSGGTQRLPRLIPLGLAYEYLLTGDAIPADEAHRLGLVNHVWPDDEVIARAMDLARRIAERSPESVASLMEAVRRGLEGPLEAGLDLERELSIENMRSADALAGLDAFAEKKGKAKT